MIYIRYIFNGDRLAFVKGYRRKDGNAQRELALDVSEPALPLLPIGEG